MNKGFGSPIGRALMLTLCFSLFASLSFAGNLLARPNATETPAITNTVILPYSNVEGRSTYQVVVNDTGAAIAAPFLNPDCRQSNCRLPMIEAHSFELTRVLTEGEGIYTLDLPTALKASVDIFTASGQFLTVHPLKPFKSAYFYSAEQSDRFNDGVFIAAVSDAVVQIANGQSFRLSAGRAAIAPSPGAISFVENRWNAGAFGLPDGELVGFEFINDKRTGALVCNSCS